jgi:hypothetical protein
MACGAPEAQAPTLMSHEGGDQGGHCFFARQPNTKAETDAAILSVYISCCGAVRYGGQDREILTRLAELGAAGSCDYELDDEPNPTSLSHATFEFEVADKPGTERATVSRQIMKYLADYFAASPSKDHRVVEFRCSEARSSFRYEWGYGGNPSLYSETFILEPHGTGRWSLRLLRENHRVTGAISTHKAMNRDARFRDIRWFSEEEWQRGDGNGRPLPY